MQSRRRRHVDVVVAESSTRILVVVEMGRLAHLEHLLLVLVLEQP